MTMIAMTPLLFAPLLLAGGADDARQTVIVVVGAAGTEEYAAAFATWSGRWKAAADRAGARFIAIGEEAGETVDRDELRRHLGAIEGSDSEAVWLVLIGHGTFDGRQAKFNLRGPDVTAAELSEWAGPLEMPLAVINCASSSGPFINRLAAPGRVVITATKSGSELNYARFGDYLSAAITDDSVDLDKDGQTSLLEAFLAASAGTAEFYDQEARLATEHSLLDDNGDALGTPADWFRGFRAVRTAKDGAAPDGELAGRFILLRSAGENAMSPAARRRRDELEREVASLREKKSAQPEQEYFERLEPLLVELARLYRESEPADAP